MGGGATKGRKKDEGKGEGCGASGGKQKGGFNGK